MKKPSSSQALQRSQSAATGTSCALFNAVSYLSMKRQKDRLFTSDELVIAAAEAAVEEIRSGL